MQSMSKRQNVHFAVCYLRVRCIWKCCGLQYTVISCWRILQRYVLDMIFYGEYAVFMDFEICASNQFWYNKQRVFSLDACTTTDITLTCGVPYTLTSPGYSTTNYPPDLTCIRNIVAPSGSLIDVSWNSQSPNSAVIIKITLLNSSTQRHSLLTTPPAAQMHSQQAVRRLAIVVLMHLLESSA